MLQQRTGVIKIVWYVAIKT